MKISRVCVVRRRPNSSWASSGINSSYIAPSTQLPASMNFSRKTMGSNLRSKRHARVWWAVHICLNFLWMIFLATFIATFKVTKTKTCKPTKEVLRGRASGQGKHKWNAWLISCKWSCLGSLELMRMQRPSMMEWVRGRVWCHWAINSWGTTFQMTYLKAEAYWVNLIIPVVRTSLNRMMILR